MRQDCASNLSQSETDWTQNYGKVGGESIMWEGGDDILVQKKFLGGKILRPMSSLINFTGQWHEGGMRELHGTCETEVYIGVLLRFNRQVKSGVACIFKQHKCRHFQILSSFEFWYWSWWWSMGLVITCEFLQRWSSSRRWSGSLWSWRRWPRCRWRRAGSLCWSEDHDQELSLKITKIMTTMTMKTRITLLNRRGSLISAPEQGFVRWSRSLWSWWQWPRCCWWRWPRCRWWQQRRSLCWGKKAYWYPLQRKASSCSSSSSVLLLLLCWSEEAPWYPLKGKVSSDEWWSLARWTKDNWTKNILSIRRRKKYTLMMI